MYIYTNVYIHIYTGGLGREHSGVLEGRVMMGLAD
jgi:hypothetical protein